MTEVVVAKFVCESISPTDAGGATTVYLRPQYGDDPNHPNKAFWDATPSGQLQMTITNPDAASFFKLDEVYTVSFEAEEKAPLPAAA